MGDIAGFLILGILIIGLVVSMIGALFSMPWSTYESKEGKPCLTFEQFLRFYELCPRKFVLSDESVKVRTKDPDQWYNDKDEFWFKTPKDLRRYQRFKRTKDELEEADRLNKESTDATQRLITMLQAEIDKHSEEANSEINGALDKQQEILNRMMGG